mgnify:CR=1 FL=1
MSEYTDIQLINCNRSASVEARSGNNSNPAIFTNPMQQSVKLDVGDTISLERSFISEIGAGNPSTIEFKGAAEDDGVWDYVHKERVDGHTVPDYTNIVYGDIFTQKYNGYNANYRLGKYRSISTSVISGENINLQDNLAPLTFGYYITSNEYPNWIQQPRRWMQSDYTNRTALPPQDGYQTYADSDNYYAGACDFSVNPNMYAFNDWAPRTRQTGGEMLKQKIKNERYTLFIKPYVSYSVEAGTDAERKTMFPSATEEGIFSECSYLRIRERKDIKIDKGFNTPSDVADQITAQLIHTEEPETFEILDDSGTENYIRPLTKTISSTTYKPINAQNFFHYNQQTYTDFITEEARSPKLGYASQLSIDYMSQYAYIGIKRPEMFEAGREMALDIIKRNVGPGIPIGQIRIEDFAGSIIPVSENEWEGFSTINRCQLPPTLPKANQISAEYGEIILNLEYNEANLKAIRTYLDTQKYYPELWDDIINSQNYNTTRFRPEGQTYPTEEDSRWFHMNQYTNTEAESTPFNLRFGSDNFVAQAGVEAVCKATNAFLFAYDDTQRDKYVAPTDFDPVINARDLYYGFAQPRTLDGTATGGNFNGGVLIEPAQWFICLRTGGIRGSVGHYIDYEDGVGGIPQTLYTNTQALPGLPGYTSIEPGRKLGYDYHATAFSTAIIAPSAGYASTDIGTLVKQAVAGFSSGTIPNSKLVNLQDTSTFISNIGAGVTDISPYMSQTYIGANDPALSYNTINNRFEFSRLHTANNVGNANRAGASGNANSETMTSASVAMAKDDELAVQAKAISTDASDTVYKVTPRPPQFGYSPNFKPYDNLNMAFRRSPWFDDPGERAAPDTDPSRIANTRFYAGANANIEPFDIFDAHGGIYIDDFGYEEQFWEGSLWDILGFSYAQLNAKASASNVLTRRINKTNEGALYRLTTNAEVVATDTKSIVANNFGASQYSTALSFPRGILDWEAGPLTPPALQVEHPLNRKWIWVDPATGDALTYYPEIIIKTESIAVPAVSLSKSVLKPYYTIRSSILEGSTAIGGNPTGSNLPIISVVDKYSAQGDYFFGNPSSLSFTITKPAVLSNIVTSIHDPDGTYSNINNTSAVIYKITKLKQAPEDIISQILKAASISKK